MEVGRGQCSPEPGEKCANQKALFASQAFNWVPSFSTSLLATRCSLTSVCKDASPEAIFLGARCARHSLDYLRSSESIARDQQNA